MSDRDGLYAAILAHPDDDVPRLVFADWLEEHGDSKYAQLIRKQIELAKVPEWDPLWVRTFHHDYDVITGRAEAAGNEKFEPKLPVRLRSELTLPPYWMAFRRGFAWHIQSDGPEPFLEHADELFATLPIQVLQIRGSYPTKPADLTALFRSPHLARLKQLEFDHMLLTEETIRQMQACPHLGNLTALEFGGGFEPAAARAVFQPPLIEQVESLTFFRASEWPALADGLASAGGPHRLRQLRLIESPFPLTVSATGLGAPLLRTLTELEIQGFELGEANARALCESLAASPTASLQSLKLNNTKPGAPSIKVLSECAALRGLKRLVLPLNRIGPVAAKYLARSPHLSGLRVLDLNSNPLRDKGAIALAESPCLPDLIELNLGGCDIGDAGATALMNRLSADKLIYLNLSSDQAKLSDAVKEEVRRKFGGIA